MPRYRYTEASFISPKLGERIVVVKRLSDAIVILNALGEGSITLVAQIDYGDFQPRVEIPIRHLKSKDEEAVWWLFDGEVEVAIARNERLPGRQVDPTARGRWPNCPRDICNVLDSLLPDSIYRLRHFAAMLLLKLKIDNHLYGVPENKRVAINAGLDEMESTIAFRAVTDSGCRDLLYLR